MAEATESAILNVIRMWAAVAWAEGALSPPEAHGLRQLVRNADLSDEERAAAWRLLTEPVVMPARPAGLSPALRRGIYRAGCRIAVVDHVCTHNERRMLDRLRELLEIPEAGAKEIEAEVPGLVVI